MTYSIRQLAAGSYDVLLDGRLIASVVLEVDRSTVTREWLVDLLNETAPDKCPAPFTSQQNAFDTQAAALEWLGI
ncbi:hypothetical protein MKK88_07245 [Methylobacterium sp. E-005]|uniref:hypothetical protein n=1 Tax=Methylobacterium sp. E-005 TaxID=2836549 RepID=UPI001FBB505E|nr:hypothetical protein [Methylobacterium sp. E-005]MCJ2085790.1 hypothetical protein [Methylobacterium sp. E-005]